MKQEKQRLPVREQNTQQYAALAEIRHYERQRDANIVRFYRSGVSMQDIANRFYVSQQWVEHVINAAKSS